MNTADNCPGQGDRHIDDVYVMKLAPDQKNRNVQGGRGRVILNHDNGKTTMNCLQTGWKKRSENFWQFVPTLKSPTDHL